VNRKRSGLTVIEILVVVGIIALLAGMLIPAASTVRKMAKEVKQRAQLTAIELGLAAFKNDYGDYPPSDPYSWLRNVTDVQNSSGAQKLAEALLGWDLLGFHPDSGFRADGANRWPYEVDGTQYAEGTYFLYDRTSNTDLEKRKGRYIDLDTADAFHLGQTGGHDGLFSNLGSLDSAADTFVLCDVFGKGKDVVQSDGSRAKAGHPILYYRAHASEKRIQDIYHYTDNYELIAVKEDADQARRGTPPDTWWNPLIRTAGSLHDYIADPRVPPAPNSDLRVPFKPDSYILISAGADGLYGTVDDICNFKR